MSARWEALIGRQYNKWIIRSVYRGKYGTVAECVCAGCGKIGRPPLYQVEDGRSTSCKSCSKKVVRPLADNGDGTFAVPLTKGHVATIDASDYDTIAPFSWCLASGGYARRAVRHGQYVLMHRVLMGAESGQEVDHINGNGLDNRRCNMRLCSHADNMKNTGVKSNSASGIKGVSRRNGRWSASIIADGVRHYLGRFDSEEEAAAAYADAAKRLHGEFARTA